MDHPRANCLFVTYVETEGPFLKVWGQTDKAIALYVQQMLFSATPEFEKGVCLIPPELFQVGLLCCAKYRDNKYYRARITHLNFLHNRVVEVIYIDYGHRDLVSITNLRTLEIFDSSFKAVRPQATGFLLAEAVCAQGEWNEQLVEEISKDIRFCEATLTPITQVAKQFLVRLYIGGNDLTAILISRGYMRHTTLTTQEAVLLSTMPSTIHQMNSPTPSPNQSIATYKAFTLLPGALYPVYVSYITDGPCNFSVQLKQTEEALGKLMKEINCMNLSPLEDLPIPGTVCLARCAEDGHICRAVVTNQVDGAFKVFYVDFGNFEVIALESLYEIPFKHVIPKAMAIRYSLAGVEKATVTLEMQCAFKNFVDNRLINMKVVPTTTRLALPKCELWDPETNQNALDVINQAATNSYPDHVSLTRGFTQTVKISYVKGCNKFYTQLKSKEDDLARLMGEIQEVCAKNDGPSINAQQLKVGLPCYALYESDGQWYRGQIIEIMANNMVKLHYVDYGNEEVLLATLLKPIEGKHLTVLRPQAIECCFNGYQNMDADTERDNLLEELILDGDFTMKVVEMYGSKSLVELYDASNYNVASLLLDKIASKRSQVGQMLLVQAGNKIEHRKPQSKSVERQDKPWQNGTTPTANDSPPWRQDNRGQRNNEFQTNEFNENKNWRQNQNNRNSERNTAAPPPRANFDRNRRNPDLNDSSGSESHKTQNRNFNDRNNQPRAYKNEHDDRGGGGDTWNQTNNETADWKQEKSGFNNRSRDGPNRGRDQDTSWDNGGDNQNSWGVTTNTTSKEDRQAFSPRNKGAFKKPDRNAGNGWNNSADTAKQGGSRKKDFKRDGSEVSSSGSEKSFNKGSKSTNYNNKNSLGGGNKSRTFDDRAAPVAGTAEIPDAASATEKYRNAEVVNTESDVTVTWFHNPLHFYVQLEQSQTPFKTLMTDIQQAYKDKIPSSKLCDIGCPVIGLFPEDGVLYRAEILDKISSQFKVRYVDFGNVATINNIYPIERRFMQLPMQAIRCGLNSIQSTAENWPDAKSYGKYFNQRRLHCKFEVTDGETTYVQLENNDGNIGQLLIKDGLASALLPPPTLPIGRIVEIPLLFAQQFRVMVLAVNSLSDFDVCLQDGTLLKCSLFMVANASQTFDNLLTAKVGQIVIVYVDNVIDDRRLEVTVYDSSGLQLKLSDGNPDAFESIEILCLYLITQSVIKGIVVHSDNNTVFLQPEDCADKVDVLLNSMFKFYNNSIFDNTLIPIENFVYAVKSSDGNWYRGRAVSLPTEGDDKVEINFIDYGNCEKVDLSALRELSAEFMEYSIMCLPVVLTVPGDHLVGNVATFSLKFTELGVKGTLVSGEPSEVAEEPPVMTESVELPPAASTNAENFGSLVVVSHVDSPGDFYLQLAECIPVIEELQAILQEKIALMTDLDNPPVAALCAAPYSADQQWYRATVLDGDSDITTVRFVDYGNTDVLDNKTVKVKTLPTDLLSLEVHATRCRMKIKPIDEEWTQLASQRFDELINVDKLTAKFLSQDEKINYVELHANGANIQEILIAESLALADDAAAPSVADNVGFVSHLNSPSEFWIQLDNCIDELEWVAEQLSGAENFPELDDVAPGSMCAALFPDDLMWYRARILSNTIAGIEVLFVDYGNSCASCSLRSLPEELVLLPPLAQKCSLNKPEGLSNWSPGMIKKFSSLSADGQTTFTLRKLSTGETNLVELLLDGADVSHLLLPATESVTVKFSTDFNDLVLMRNGQRLDGEFKLEPLTDIDFNEESIKKFQEINKNVIFQCEFVTDNIIRLYLDLDDIRLDLGGDKKSVMSSPVKIRSELNQESLEVVKSIVEVLLENASDDAFGVVEPIVTGIVSSATRSPEAVHVTIETPKLRVNDDQSDKDIIVTGTVDSVGDNLSSESPKSPELVDCTVKGEETAMATGDLVGSPVNDDHLELQKSPETMVPLVFTTECDDMVETPESSEKSSKSPEVGEVTLGINDSTEIVDSEVELPEVNQEIDDPVKSPAHPANDDQPERPIITGIVCSASNDDGTFSKSSESPDVILDDGLAESPNTSVTDARSESLQSSEIALEINKLAERPIISGVVHCGSNDDVTPPKSSDDLPESPNSTVTDGQLKSLESPEITQEINEHVESLLITDDVCSTSNNDVTRPKSPKSPDVILPSDDLTESSSSAVIDGRSQSRESSEITQGIVIPVGVVDDQLELSELGVESIVEGLVTAVVGNAFKSKIEDINDVAPINDDLVGSAVVPTMDDEDNEDMKSRPGSSGSGKIPHDEKIVAAAISNPQILTLNEAACAAKDDCDIIVTKKDVSGDLS